MLTPVLAYYLIFYLPAGINSEQYEAAKMDELRMKVIPVVATLSNSQIPFLKTQMVMTYDQALPSTLIFEKKRVQRRGIPWLTLFSYSMMNMFLLLLT